MRREAKPRKGKLYERVTRTHSTATVTISLRSTYKAAVISKNPAMVGTSEVIGMPPVFTADHRSSMGAAIKEHVNLTVFISADD